MAQRVLEINVAYAQDLKDVNLFTKMDVYVVVSVIGGNSNIKQKTNVHRDSGTHPTWNFPMRFTIDEFCALQGRLLLIFKLKCEGSLTDAGIGEVCVPIEDLLHSSSHNGDGKSGKYVHYQVTKPSGRGQGMLTFSYKFGDGIYGAQTVEPVKISAEATHPTAHPPFPPPQQPMGPSFGYSRLSGHGTYPPDPYPYHGYVYPPAPNPYPYPYPPPPEQATGSLYIYPPPPSQGPIYPYPPHHQLEQAYPPPSTGGGYIYPYPLPPPPPPEPRYGYPPQAYPGYGYPLQLQ